MSRAVPARTISVSETWALVCLCVYSMLYSETSQLPGCALNPGKGSNNSVGEQINDDCQDSTNRKLWGNGEVRRGR